MREKILRFFEYLILGDLSLFIVLAPYSSLYSKVFIYSSAFLWIIFCVFSYRLRFYRHLIAPNILNKDFRLFFLVLLIATRFSLDYYHSQGIFFSRYLGFTLAFLLGSAMAQHRHRVYVLVGAIIFASIIIGIGGLWDHWHLSADERLYTSFGYDVNLSALLALYFPFICLLILFAKKHFFKWGSLINAIILYPCFVANMSRVVLYAVPASIVVSCYTQKKRLAFLLTIVTIISFYFYSPFLKARIAETFKQDIRVYRSGVALGIFEDFPVIGAGLGMFEKLRSIYDVDSNREYIHSENTFTELLSETGFLGLTVFLWLLAVFFKNAFTLLKQIKDPNQLAIHLGLTAAMISALTVSFATNSIMVGFQNAVIFWLIFGLASGMVTQVQKVPSDTNENV